MQIITITKAFVRRHFPKRHSASHKGDNGRVIVIGGSREYVGAPYFAGLGATASGADLVHLTTPAIVAQSLRRRSPNLLIRETAGSKDHLTSTAVTEVLKYTREPHTAAVIGPGLGAHPSTKKAILKLLGQISCPLVIDASALLPEIVSVIQDSKLNIQNSKLILTPHHGEFQRLTNLSPTTANLRRTADQLNTTILLKGATDYVATRGILLKNTTGSPILTVGGTGDVLAGLAAGLLARGAAPHHAAALATYILGKTGEALAKKYESITAELLAAEVPQIVKKLI